MITSEAMKCMDFTKIKKKYRIQILNLYAKLVFDFVVTQKHNSKHLTFLWNIHIPRHKIISKYFGSIYAIHNAHILKTQGTMYNKVIPTSLEYFIFLIVEKN